MVAWNPSYLGPAALNRAWTLVNDERDADRAGHLAAVADDVICLRTPEPFAAVGLWYEEFPQTSDEEVAELLATPTVPGRTPIRSATPERRS